jgi:hypothetical protein
MIHKLGEFSLALGNLSQMGVLFTKSLIDKFGDLSRDLSLVAHDISAGETQERVAEPLQNTIPSAILASYKRKLVTA